MRNLGIKFSERLTLTFCMALVVAVLSAGCAARQSGMEKAASSPLAEITSIELSQDVNFANVVIRGTEPLTYMAVKQREPIGVVILIPGSRLTLTSPDLQSPGPPVKAIHASQAEAKIDTSRIEILLAADSSYNVVKDGNALKIQFSKTPLDVSSAATVLPAPSVQSNPSPATPQTVASTGVYQGTGMPVGSENQIWVNRIDFLGEPNGRSTLSIETTAPVDYKINKVSNRLLELRLMGTNIAEFRQRPLITTRFESAVNRIVPVQLPSMRGYSLFSIELREPVGYHTEQVGGLLLVHFDASSVPPAPVDEANLPAWKKVLTETLGMSGMDMTGSGAQSSGTPRLASQPNPDTVGEPAMPDVVLDSDQAVVVTKKIKTYKGEKIALDFYQTDIKNVFRILREVSGKNFAIDKDVSGKVTMTLDKPVPWDQVMDLVLRMNQLGMIVEGDIIRIATLSTLKKENDLRKAQIASLQEEKKQIKALEPLETRYIPISYSDAGKEVLPHIQNIISKDRGSVTVDTKNNQLIVTDTADKIAQAIEIARQIDKVTSQVIIEARIVEISETFSREVGFEWGLSVGPVSMNEGGTTYETNVAMNYPASTSNGIGLTYNKIAGTPFTLDAALTALETNGKGKILSSPKIVTLNNKKAKIKQGQEYGYLERDSSGGSSVSFKDVDLLLEVTPHVTPDNRISLSILITKNDVVDFVDDVPVISTNEAETELLVNDGDTIVIGGIIKKTRSNTKNAFPGLHKVPVLGWLFQSNLEENDNSELLIFMNPKIVQLEQRNMVN
ncbi:type IV pilus secretin PilQ [Desulfosarcina ovata]|uniref:Pilus modification protein PilQ n=1 Tax=Desulfosarcina ovata subsp. ovata TaxID=2752305 RepID=A0A5K8AE28_9BACT|nr:type IV pilus secretin PilQ [Desulfosarcina ovata]BBO90821.1 hypothetical protein DSCOOX_40010 [Desulfosarcina ovata subsp. ovata]